MNKLLSAHLSLFLVTAAAQCAPQDARDEPSKPTVESPSPPAPSAARPSSDLGAPAVRVPIDGLPAFGSERALVTVVAFLDYECPYCARADERIATLRAEYGDRVRFVVASRPLPIHERAESAARAFLAAAEQGKGEAMHRRLFASQKALDAEGLRVAARDVGLDLAAFDRAMHSGSTDAALRRAEGLAAKLSVEGTPTFFVNGRRLVGARPIETFRALVDEELSRARRLVESGVAPERVYAKLLAEAPEHSPPKVEPAVERVVDVDVADAPVRGAARAPVTIVLFSDFECPFCAKAERTLRALEAANPGKVRVAFRHRPLPMHAHARLAAKASLAAERQGRFWEYHDALLLHRDALERDDLVRHAVELGLDRARFVRDLDDPALDARLEADARRAEQLDVKGTPTAFVNGRRIVGAQALAVWQAAVDRASVGLR